jgi:hypothetical protein
MATKKVTRGEKPKRKIIISTVEMKKELITKWESGTHSSDLLFSMAWQSQPY